MPTPPESTPSSPASADTSDRETPPDTTPSRRMPRPNQLQGNDPAARMRAWRDVVEEQLAEARERGAFDNLPGNGKPLRLDTNLYAGDKALAYSILKNNNVAPPEIERGHEVDDDLKRAEEPLRLLRHRLVTLRARGKAVFASDRRAYNILRDNTLQRYAGDLRAINSKILSLNIIAPPALHRRSIDVDARIQAFEDEFPRMVE
ncbi:MAG: DnaJ family domain-containing protein [Ktedonobacterales bacterium]